MTHYKIGLTPYVDDVPLLAAAGPGGTNFSDWLDARITGKTELPGLVPSDRALTLTFAKALFASLLDTIVGPTQPAAVSEICGPLGGRTTRNDSSGTTGHLSGAHRHRLQRGRL